MSRNSPSGDRIFRVLGYREDGEWVALALEMDIRGYGPTFEAALAEMKDLVEAQISFAIWRKRPEMIWNAAEPEYFERYERVLRILIEAMYSAPSSPEFEDFRVAGMPVPPPHVIAANSEGLRWTNA